MRALLLHVCHHHVCVPWLLLPSTGAAAGALRAKGAGWLAAVQGATAAGQHGALPGGAHVGAGGRAGAAARVNCGKASCVMHGCMQAGLNVSRGVNV
jgi:hypothetical protein